jgi:hypothetical protein
LALGVVALGVIRGGDNGDGSAAGPTGSPNPPAQTSATTQAAAQPGTAIIRLTPGLGPDSRKVDVRGSGFGANEEVALSLDGTEAKRLHADSSGAFAASLTVPFSKSSFTVRADGVTSNRSATGTVTF